MSRTKRFVIAVAVTFLTSLSSVLGGEITFSFNYDSSFDTAAGANASIAKSDFAFVGNYLSSMIKTSVPSDVTMIFDISGESDSESSTLGSAGSDFFGFSNSFNKTATQIIAQTGSYSGSSSAVVGNAIFNFGKSWGFGGDVAGSEFDFRYVLLHEMTHALGFIGSIGASGGTVFSNGFHGWMDQYLYGWDGSAYQKLVQTGTSLVAMSGASAAVKNSTHPVQYRGPNVLAYLGNSTGQNMYTPSVFDDGSSIYHVNIVGDLMYYSTGPGLKTFGYSGLHQAFLRDLGYSVVPEPGAYALALVSVIVLGACGKVRGRSQVRLRTERIG
jgi:hypothetical protein